jgi:hypothetical protein
MEACLKCSFEVPSLKKFSFHKSSTVWSVYVLKALKKIWRKVGSILKKYDSKFSNLGDLEGLPSVKVRSA